MLKVKDVVIITGLSKRTLQYYDEIELMRPNRSALNYRIYTDADLERLWQIQVYKEMGFQLNEIKRLLRVSDDMQRSQLLEKKLQHIDEKIAGLESDRSFIERIKNYGIPARRTIKSKYGALTYREMAKLLAESID